MKYAFIAWCRGVPPVFVDGCLYLGIAVFGTIQGLLATDEAAKYISPGWLFLLRSTAAVLNVGLTSLKMFRSSSYADYMKKKKDDNDATT